MLDANGFVIEQVPHHRLAEANNLLLDALPDAKLTTYLTNTSRVIGAFIGGELRACLHIDIVNALWMGERIKVGQMGPGATHAHFRDRGLMGAVVREAFRELHRQGALLAGQETPIVGYHRRSGWEIGTTVVENSFSAGALSGADLSDGIRLAGVADLGDFSALWNGVGRHRPLVSVRDAASWQNGEGLWWVSNSGPRNGAARVSGLASNGAMRVEELYAPSTREARGLLLSLANEHGIGHLQLVTSDQGAVFFEWEEPREVSIALQVDKVFRVVDAEGCLNLLASKTKFQGSDTWSIDVVDELCDWNNRNVTYVAGRERQARDGDYWFSAKNLHMSVDIRALVPLFTGLLNTTQLGDSALADVEHGYGSFRQNVRASWYPDRL